MFDIWSSLAELHQPCLYRGIGDRLISDDGLVRREILTSLDRLFCEHLAAGQASFQAPPTPSAIPAASRFLNVSALQKAIRRGDSEGAMRFAQQGCGLNSEQVFRRLATCAVEDVGLGNLLVVGMALAVLGNRSMRQNGASELAAYLASVLADSPKSRLFCDLLSIVDYDRGLDGLKKHLATAPVSELCRRANDRSSTHAERMAAAWMLAGTARFRGTTMPSVSRPRVDIMRMMAVSRMPLMLYYLADRAAARVSDAMFVSSFLVGEMLAADPEVTIAKKNLPETMTIAGFPAAAFDLHTHEGRAALSRFGRECLPVANMLHLIPPTLRDTVIQHAVFIVEGGRLRNRLRFADADATELKAHRAELAFAGLHDEASSAEFLATITEHLPALDQLRRRIGR